MGIRKYKATMPSACRSRALHEEEVCNPIQDENSLLSLNKNLWDTGNNPTWISSYFRLAAHSGFSRYTHPQGYPCVFIHW